MVFPDNVTQACKRYMHAEDVRDYEITPFMEAAAEYLGYSSADNLTSLQKLALFSLTLSYYDHRDAVNGEADMPIGLRPIINKLKIEQLAAQGDE